MKCPYCGSKFLGELQHCPNCKQPLSRAMRGNETQEPADVPERSRRTLLERIFLVLACMICVIGICVGIYKLVFWMENYRITRLYTRGAYTPTVNTVQMDDGRVGHSLVFYGEDGDHIFLPELNQSLSICGNVARTEIADADWFGSSIDEIEAANVSLSPVLISEKGTRTQLPPVKFTVTVPDSPLTVISPARNRLSISTALYLLELQVVPGSTVIINGEDVTDMIDRSGLLSKNVNVYPIGDNVYTVIVRTPSHRETRYEIVIYREDFDIAMELDSSVGNTASNEIMVVSGTTEPGAWITVETMYLQDSLSVDMSTGKFSFIAQFSNFGDNIVRFRASMDGREDAIVSINVNYTPTLAKYSSLAWRMDYQQLRSMYVQWEGQVFKCNGQVLEIIRQNNSTYLVMDVGTIGNRQLVILENISSLTDPVIGRRYEAYADVSGRFMYNAEYYPLLIARYIDLET